jgi:hypothetical protein
MDGWMGGWVDGLMDGWMGNRELVLFILRYKSQVENWKIRDSLALISVGIDFWTYVVC